MTSDRMVINRTRPAIGQDAARRRPTSCFSTDRTRLGDVHCRRRPGIPPAAGAVPPHAGVGRVRAAQDRLDPGGPGGADRQVVPGQRLLNTDNGNSLKLSKRHV